jgi:hypothetical protein
VRGGGGEDGEEKKGAFKGDALDDQDKRAQTRITLVSKETY